MKKQRIQGHSHINQSVNDQAPTSISHEWPYRKRGLRTRRKEPRKKKPEAFNGLEGELLRPKSIRWSKNQEKSSATPHQWKLRSQKLMSSSILKVWSWIWRPSSHGGPGILKKKRKLGKRPSNLQTTQGARAGGTQISWERRSLRESQSTCKIKTRTRGSQRRTSLESTRREKVARPQGGSQLHQKDRSGSTATVPAIWTSFIKVQTRVPETVISKQQTQYSTERSKWRRNPSGDSQRPKTSWISHLHEQRKSKEATHLSAPNPFNTTLLVRLNFLWSTRCHKPSTPKTSTPIWTPSIASMTLKVQVRTWTTTTPAQSSSPTSLLSKEFNHLNQICLQAPW